MRTGIQEQWPFLLVSCALLALVASACIGPSTPEDRGIEVNRDIIAITNQDKAMLMLEIMVEDEFGVELDSVFEDTVVWWADTTCQGHDPGTYGIQRESGCVYGVMWSCQEMYVALSNLDPTRTCGSALLHEFGHCLSMHVWGHANGDHDQPVWNVVEEAHELSCKNGW